MYLFALFRDHPDTIKRRFISVAVICVIVLPILWGFGSVSNRKNVSIVLPAKSDSDVMFCLQSYQGLMIDESLVY